MLRASKSDPLDLEFPADEREKIDPGDDHVAAKHAGWFVFDAEVGTEFFEHFGRKKSDLAFVVFAEIKIAITAQAVTGNTLHIRDFYERKVTRRLAIMTDEVVAG